MKKRSLSLLFSILALGTVLVTGSGFTTDNPSTDHPDGYMAGRSDAKYGTYGTVVQPSARGFQDRIVGLQNKAYGLSQMTNLSLVQQSKASYLLENQLINLDLEIANAPSAALTPFERQTFLYQVARAYTTVRQQSERLYENMIRYIDHELPGPNGQQIRSETKKGNESIYQPNYRSDKDLTPSQKTELYNKMLEAFLKKKGNLNEVKSLDRNYVDAMGPVTRVEYVQMVDGSIRVTEGKAGHILLAQGKPVKAAGQILFVKDMQDNVVLMVLSNASGSYKPDILSAEVFAEVVQKIARVSKMNTVITKGEPLSSQAVKIYLKGQRVDPALIDRQVQVLEQEGQRILFPAKGFTSECAAVFAS